MRVRCVAVALALTGLLGRGLGAQVIDRILAVVDGSIITQSDVSAARRLGLVTQPVAGSSASGSILDRLIERQLILAEVERYGAPQPGDAEVEARVGEVRARVSGGEAFARVLAESGLNDELLKRVIRENLRLESYVAQRFGPGPTPTEDDLLEYYQAHPTQFSPGGVVRPLAEVHDAVRSAVIESRREGQVRDWIDGLRRRANVTVLGGTPGL